MNKLFNTIIKNSITLCVVGGGIIASNAQTNAATIIGDITGSDTSNTFDMFGVEFRSDSGNVSELAHVRSVTFDLKSNGFFDFSDDSSFNNQKQPVLGSLVGLTADDISFDFDAEQSQYITFNFQEDSFGVGDSFRFAASTSDNLVSGGDFGDKNVVLFSSFEDFSSSSNSSFKKINDNKSITTDPNVAIENELEPEIVPEPLTILGTGVALGLGSLMKKRKQENS